jgi:hypothetical protein
MVLKHYIWLYLWVAPHVLLAVVAAMMVRSRRYRDFPIFFSYLLFEILQFCILFGMSRVESVPWSIYQQIDLFGRAGSIAFRFAMIQEILEASVAPSPSLRRTMAWALRCSAAVLALLAFLFIGSVYSWSVREMIFPAYAVNQTFNILQCGLLAFVFLWHRFLGVKMQDMAVGIALGMGLVAGLEPVLDALKNFRVAAPQVVDLLQMGAYHISVVIWLYFAKAHAESPSGFAVASFLDARRWALELRRLKSL